jgi:3-oxoacyl-[acyl-carrier-protein] synthase III
MKVASVSISTPSREVTIDETIELIKAHSQKSFKGDLGPNLRRIRAMLRHSGADKRRWLAKDETPINLLMDACTTAITDAGLQKSDIDCVIYGGVGRGYIEPGSAYLMAKALELNNCDCFDILDACMSQMRSLHISEQYLKSGIYKNILIINGEITNFEGGPLYPQNYSLKSQAQLEWIIPSYTIGDCATAMIVTSDTDNDWDWNFSARSDLADLCTLPVAGFELFTHNPDKEGRGGVNSFCSFGHLMHAEGSKEIVNIFSKLTINTTDIDHIFPHTSSKTAWEACAIECGVSDKMRYLYPNFGNVASSSLGAGMATAIHEGTLKRGDTCVGWIGSAGMSFCAVSFNY